MVSSKLWLIQALLEDLATVILTVKQDAFAAQPVTIGYRHKDDSRPPARNTPLSP